MSTATSAAARTSRCAPKELRNCRIGTIRPCRACLSAPCAAAWKRRISSTPGVPQTIIGGFRECDFGDFENKNYAELNGRADYQAWIDSGGELPFPHGESRAQFAARCVTAFEQIRQQDEDCAVVAHGGTLMAIMGKVCCAGGRVF